MGASSAPGSIGRLAPTNWGVMDMVLIGQVKTVLPSGVLRATTSAATTPFTPVRFSTTARAPSSGPTASATRRETKSEEPPAAAPLTTRTLHSGCCAAAGAARAEEEG